MIITDCFILINFPKTGSTFAREAIRTIYKQHPGKFFCEYLAPIIVDSSLAEGRSQHGTVQQIPAEHKSKEIVSIVRNPLARYVSLYTFRWWEKFPQTDVNTLKVEFPLYPEISFREYMLMTEKYALKNALRAIGTNRFDLDIGLHSLQFIQYYAYDPLKTIQVVAENGWGNSLLKTHFPEIVFLKQECLLEDLCSFMTNKGFSSEEIQMIRKIPPRNVSRKSAEVSIEKYYDDAMLEHILIREKILFDIFPEYKPLETSGVL